MIERPILFSAPMVRALLAGTKTQTRRVVKLPRRMVGGDLAAAFAGKMLGVTPGLHVPMPDGSVQRLRNPWGWPEPSRLWVRETFVLQRNVEDEPPPFRDGRPIKRGTGDYESSWWQPHYRATDPTPELYYEDSEDPACRWRPSIFMPRWASRITLEVIRVRVERLHGINEADAVAEGADWGACGGPQIGSHRAGYAALWEQINGPGTWDANPWVWVVEFQRIDSA